MFDLMTNAALRKQHNLNALFTGSSAMKHNTHEIVLLKCKPSELRVICIAFFLNEENDVFLAPIKTF